MKNYLRATSHLVGCNSKSLATIIVSVLLLSMVVGLVQIPQAKADIPTMVQGIFQGGTQTSNTFTITIGSALSIGQVIVMGYGSAAQLPSGCTLVSVTETGVTWTIPVGASSLLYEGYDDAWNVAQGAFGVVTSGSASLTITVVISGTVTSSQSACADVAVFRGLAGTMEAYGVATQAYGTNQPTGSVVTTTDGDLIFGFVCTGFGGTTMSSPQNSFILYDGNEYGYYQNDAYLVYQSSTHGTFSSGVTSSGSTAGSGIIMAFQPSVGGGGSSDAPLSANPNYPYTLAKNTTTNYIIASNGTFVYNNGNPITALTQGLSYVNNTGTNLYVQNGTYTGVGASFIASHIINAGIVFNTSSTLTISNNFNGPVVYLDSCTNFNLTGIHIDGNRLNQNNPYWSADGVSIYNCSNCLTTNGNITNCATYGWTTMDDALGVNDLPNGVTNSLFTFCDQNSINLGSSFGSVGNSTTKGAYAINNTVKYSSDVGITMYGNNDICVGNSVIDTNGTAHLSSKYAISVEGNGNNIIENNTITNAGVGIQIGTGLNPTQPYVGNLIINNNITNCAPYGISLSGQGDIVTHNNITTTLATPMGSPTYSDIQIGGVADWETSVGNIVSFNTMYDNLGSGNYFWQGVIWLQQTLNNSVCNNTITTNIAANSIGVDAQFTNFTIMSGNIIQAGHGIDLSTNGFYCMNNKINGNNLTSCTIPITDLGTSTIINPTSSPTYTLTICNPYDSSSQATYSYSNITQKVLTCSNGFNINGVNQTSPQTITMGQDYFVYALGSGLTLTDLAPSPTPTPTNSLNLTAGWNLVSFSVTPSNASFASILANVSSYQVRTWNGTAYTTPLSAVTGQAYWVFTLTNTTQTVSGTEVTSATIHLTAGWNMIGSVYGKTVTASSVLTGYYQLSVWTGTQYQTASSIQDGKGYFVLVLTGTDVTLQ